MIIEIDNRNLEDRACLKGTPDSNISTALPLSSTDMRVMFYVFMIAYRKPNRLKYADLIFIECTGFTSNILINSEEHFGKHDLSPI